MRLSSIQYTEWEELPKVWRLDGLALHEINLLVGKNSTGKSRCLNLIHGLAQLLTGKRPVVSSGNYNAIFEHNQHKITYELKIENSSVVHEVVSEDNAEPQLRRGEHGIGKIYYEKEEKFSEFQLPQNQLAAVARQDTLQHKFLLPLQEWASSVYHYPFGSDMGQATLGVLQDTLSLIDFHDPRQVIGVYRAGASSYGEKYKKSIIDDMEAIGYDIEAIDLVKPTSVMVAPGAAIFEPVYLCVKERSLPRFTEQSDMSQGMFRALSTLIHVSYGCHSAKSNLLLIDDIGEGLDFERSCALIDVVIQRARGSNAQLLMATNDRFIMNSVPLEYWSVLERRGAVVNVHNYENSRKKFEDFKFTGLNNFDFFATDFIHSEEVKS
jgi:hypothetical protein